MEMNGLDARNFDWNAVAIVRDQLSGVGCELVVVVINEQHEILPDQLRAMNDHFNDPFIARLDIPSEGLTSEEIIKLANELVFTQAEIVFLSPVPLLLANVVAYATVEAQSVGILHNDHREKKELPDGKIIQTVAQEGWELFWF